MRQYGSIEEVIRNLPMITKSREPRYHDYCRNILNQTFGVSFDGVTVVESIAKQHLLTELSQGFAIMLEQEAEDAVGLYGYSLQGVFNETLQLYYTIKHVPQSLRTFITYINQVTFHA
jgi:hypothetical protein